MKRAEFKPNRSLPIPQLLWKKVPGAEAVSAVVAAAAANHNQVVRTDILFVAFQKAIFLLKNLFLVKGAMKKGFKKPGEIKCLLYASTACVLA